MGLSAQGNVLEVCESLHPCPGLEEAIKEGKSCSSPGVFPPPGWAGNNCGAAGTHRGDLAVTPAGLGRAGFGGRRTFLHSCFWIRAVLVKETVGSLPLVSGRAAPPGAFWGMLAQEGS